VLRRRVWSSRPEEAQIIGGLGGAVAESLSEHLPIRLLRLGVHDRFGESGKPQEVLEHFGLTGRKLVEPILAAQRSRS
jgi:transketolase